MPQIIQSGVRLRLLVAMPQKFTSRRLAPETRGSGAVQWRVDRLVDCEIKLIASMDLDEMTKHAQDNGV